MVSIMAHSFAVAGRHLRILPCVDVGEDMHAYSICLAFGVGEGF